MKKKVTALEGQVFSAWEELAFRDGGFDRPPIEPKVQIDNARKRIPEWEAILAIAFDDQEWKVGPGHASMISTSIWFSAMLIGDYNLAERAIERCLEHPGSFDRHDSTDLPIRLQCVRLVRDRSPGAALALTDIIACGVYRPGMLAREIFHCLSCWIKPVWNDGREVTTPVPNEAKSLALALAVALRAGKRHREKVEAIQTWEDFGRYIAIAAG